MKNILLIFALLIASCDTKDPLPCKLVAIQISDANPIQFWPVDCLTYNENEVCGIHPKCWCHPWQCDDEIKIQFTDNEFLDYFLVAVDETGNDVLNLPFQSYQAYPGNVADIFSTLGFPAFSNFSGSGPLWNLAGPPYVDLLSGASGSYTLKTTSPVICPEGIHTIRYTGTNTAAAAFLYVKMQKDGVVIDSVTSIPVPVGAFSLSFQVDLSEWTNEVTILAFKITGAATRVTISGMNTDLEVIPASPVVYSISVTPEDESICDEKVQFKIMDGSSPGDELYKSDCIDIATTQDCTTVIDYSNNRNFAGLIYDDSASPETTFNIRVPAIFFHEQFPEEDEAMELTTGIQKTSGTLKVQRLFDTDYMPYYMHKKLQLIFKHQFITIDRLSWLKEEKYDIQPGERRWPIKKAKCFLTQDYIQRAVL